MKNAIFTMANFLLQTDNYDPLIKLVNQVNEKINKNNQLIETILNTADSLTFPSKLTPLNNDSQSEDELRYHLDMKYKLHEMEAPKFEDVKDPMMKQLLIDNYKLLQIKKINQVVNVSLFNIVRQYEEFIGQTLIPMLREDFGKEASRGYVSLTKIVDNKLQANEVLWQRYNDYIIQLQRLFDLFNQLSSMLQLLDSNAVVELESKLIAIESLISKVYKSQ